MTATTSKLSTLRLVYPPISNQEAFWLENDEEVQKLLKQSDFYIIAGRGEAKFSDISVDAEEKILGMKFNLGEEFSDEVIIDVRMLPSFENTPDIDFLVEGGEKLIRIWSLDGEGNRDQVMDWFTTEKLLFDTSRGKSGILGFERYREAYRYDLLYVGIAKVGDSYERLIAHGHKARTAILSNEPQRLPGARVTDEIYMLLFRVEPLFITSFDADHEFDDDEDLVPSIQTKSVVADAEKAFVRLLDPKYNSVKYSSYPKGADGLYEENLARYSYVVGENLTLDSAKGRFRGSWNPALQFISNDGDCIFVEDDKVELLLSGVHYAIDKAE